MAKLNLKKIKAKAEEIKQREKAQKEKQSDGSAFFNKIPVGMIEMRLLPPWSTAGELSKEIWTHFGLPPGNTTIVDYEKSFPDLGLVSPINEVLEEFKDDLDVSRLWSKPTPKINVYFPDSDINQDNEELPDGILGQVKILAPSAGTYNQIVKLISNPRIGDITDPDEGYNITIEKTTGKKWQDTRYNVQLAPPQGPIHDDEDEQERILEKTWDLDKIFPAPDDEKIAEMETVAKALRKYLEKQLREVGGGATSRRRPARKAADEEAEDDEEPEDSDVAEEEEEEEEQPRRRAPKKAAKKKTKSRKASDDDEESDESFSEAEVDEEPRTTRRSSSKKTGKTTAKRAKGKPDCFADPDVFKIDDEQAEACNSCIWEVPCVQQQKKDGTFCHVE